MIINSHGGHNRIVSGARGYLDELKEDRRVNKYFIEYMKKSGHTVYNCTDNVGLTANRILYNVVKKHNKHKADFGISFHLNASNGEGHGVEAYYYDEKTKTIAGIISKAVADELGITNRGAKDGSHLYVVRNTREPLILLECCFVDNKEDYRKWNAKRCAYAVASAINKYYGVKPVPEKTPEKTPEKPQKKPQADKQNGYKVKVTVDALNVRKEPSTNARVVGCIRNNGVYTITKSYKGWGKLKSGMGWIYLNYTKRV